MHAVPIYFVTYPVTIVVTRMSHYLLVIGVLLPRMVRSKEGRKEASNLLMHSSTNMDLEGRGRGIKLYV